MALYLDPNHAFALVSLANAYETSRRYEDAIAAYDRVPKDTPLQSEIEIRKAFDLNSLDKVDEAKVILDKLIAENPGDVKALDALGSIMRVRKRYAEAVDYYTRALALVKKPSKRHWSLFYSRGTCYERLKNWPPAEADLKKALNLYPDQPMVLNYLGYSWIDQNNHLKEGMSLIEKAVALKPDDGYIVDSLGWAHFKLGNFKEAVRFLERAVELKPEDPVLNDHLGDALWHVGREREARFQWDQALTLEPEPEDVEKIKKKLAEGLPGSVEASSDSETLRNVRLKKRKETKLTPPQVE
jgi:tetratricopeptide (TPR) repeat protein